jgi:hypothetical protein
MKIKSASDFLKNLFHIKDFFMVSGSDRYRGLKIRICHAGRGSLFTAPFYYGNHIVFLVPADPQGRLPASVEMGNKEHATVTQVFYRRKTIFAQVHLFRLHVRRIVE